MPQKPLLNRSIFVHISSAGKTWHLSVRISHGPCEHALRSSYRGPPSDEETMSQVQKSENKSRALPRAQHVRRVGTNGNYWYAVELSKNLGPKGIKEVKYWGQSIALFRGEDGKVRAVENRCAHRQLALTTGVVQGDHITCQYHGWQYDGCGRCVSIDHELGKNRTKFPKITIASYPIKERYGLIWLFPGDAEKAETVPLPVIPQLDQA